MALRRHLATALAGWLIEHGRGLKVALWMAETCFSFLIGVHQVEIPWEVLVGGLLLCWRVHWHVSLIVHRLIL